MSAALYVETRPGRPLGTVVGLVHGIVSLDPPAIQCDRCLVVRTFAGRSAAVAVLTSRITFGRGYPTGDKRRLCEACAAVEWEAAR